MKKLILIKVDLEDAREKRKALKTVAALSGIDEISMDMKGKKLTIIGTVDPVSVVSKLRKFWWAEILIVGPVKEPEKKKEIKKKEPKKEEIKKEEEPPKEEPKKEEPPKEEAKEEEPPKEEAKKEEPPKEEAKKEEPKKGGEKKEEPKKEEEKKPQPQPQPQRILMPQPQPYLQAAYRPYYPPMHTYYQVHHSMEENPNACNIC